MTRQRTARRQRLRKSESKQNRNPDPLGPLGDDRPKEIRKLENDLDLVWPFRALLVDPARVREECGLNDLSDEAVVQHLRRLSEAIRLAVGGLADANGHKLRPRVDDWLEFSADAKGKEARKVCEKILTLSDEQRARCVVRADWSVSDDAGFPYDMGGASLHDYVYPDAVEKVQTDDSKPPYYRLRIDAMPDRQRLQWAVLHVVESDPDLHKANWRRALDETFIPCWAIAPVRRENVRPPVDSGQAVPILYVGSLETAFRELRRTRNAYSYDVAHEVYRANKDALCLADTPVEAWLVDPSPENHRPAALYAETLTINGPVLIAAGAARSPPTDGHPCVNIRTLNAENVVIGSGQSTILSQSKVDRSFNLAGVEDSGKGAVPDRVGRMRRFVQWLFKHFVKPLITLLLPRLLKWLGLA